MTEARTAILGGLRRTAAAPGPMPELPVRRFDWDLDERLDRFQQALAAVHGEVHRVGADWPRVLAGLLQQAGAANLRYGPGGPLAAALTAGWPADGARLVPHDQAVEDCRGDLFDATDAGFTSCRAGIAETGSLVLWPTPAEPRLLSLIPPMHCVLLEAARIVSTLHELMAAEVWGGGLPTNALVITGPSKSADIEQTLTYGVHGPARLIVLVRDERRRA
jgi:L-lactate dehydrogenase complex protein LldG